MQIVFRDELVVVQWEREHLGRIVLLPGENKLVLNAESEEPFDLALQSIEIFTEEVERELSEIQSQLAADTVRIQALIFPKMESPVGFCELSCQEKMTVQSNVYQVWMQKANFGIFFHWNSKSMPLAGPPVDYASAVAQFNVTALAELVAEVGAGFVVFTTTWAGFFFPGNSVDSPPC